MGPTPFRSGPDHWFTDTAPAVIGSQLGYARVNTDKLSSTSTLQERLGLAALLDYTRQGDAILVVGIDRLDSRCCLYSARKGCLLDRVPRRPDLASHYSENPY
jgi:hypothetical protein